MFRFTSQRFVALSQNLNEFRPSLGGDEVEVGWLIDVQEVDDLQSPHTRGTSRDETNAD